jgi:Fic family protein
MSPRLMKITEQTYLKDYEASVGDKIANYSAILSRTDLITDLGYKNQASAVYSANIEGNSIDLNSFMNHALLKAKGKNNKEIVEIENLVAAYEFAQGNQLNTKNLLNCHAILSETLLIKSKRGHFRNEKIGVFDQYGLVYLAIEPEFVDGKMNEFFADLEKLLNTDLSPTAVFYHAALIHLIFAHIHPFSDGNGRVARLLEKWFIAEKLGEIYWNLQTEKYYKEHRQDYYENIKLGANYYELDYSACLPFLLMSVNSLT